MSNVARKLIEAHRVGGRMEPGSEISLHIDQTLTQDATGTLVMLELEAMGLDRVRTELSVQYVDHNIIQTDHRNADDHLFLRSACRRFGLWYSTPGNGVSHPLHQEHFGRPGRALLGADSHTCAAGALGMLAIGAGGLDVALAMAGEPYYLRMPAVFGVRLVGRLSEHVSAKDVVLEMLRRHGVDGGLGRIIEYHGPGLEALDAMDRHVIANMGAELGATTTVFPSDLVVQRYLERQGRGDQWVELLADSDATYDAEDEIDLSQLEPLIALPPSPGQVVLVQEVAGREIYQAYVGSSANPGFRDFAAAAEIVRGWHVHDNVSFDVNPTTRGVLQSLLASGHLGALIEAGARLHQAGCNGCIGMGQAPATGRISLRTVPRNFPGRSGTREDQVYLCSPETAAISAVMGRITDPRESSADLSRIQEPASAQHALDGMLPPPPLEEARQVELVKGPNIRSLPVLAVREEAFEAPILLALGDDVSTDEILPAGSRVLPYRSNIPHIAQFAFGAIDETYAARAREVGDHVVVAGRNYGQGSSREHAALAPRTLGLRAVIAVSFARIHRQNLINHGVLPLTFVEPADLSRLTAGRRVILPPMSAAVDAPGPFAIGVDDGTVVRVEHDLSSRESDVLRGGGRIQWIRQRIAQARGSARAPEPA